MCSPWVCCHYGDDLEPEPHGDDRTLGFANNDSASDEIYMIAGKRKIDTSGNILSKIDSVRIEIEYTEYEYAPIDEDGNMIGDSVAFCFHEDCYTEIYIGDELSDEEAETEYSGYKPYKFDETEHMGCWENSVRAVYYLNVENFDASKLVEHYDCYDVPCNDGTIEASFMSLKYDGKVIEFDQESYSCENNDFCEISIPAEFIKESKTKKNNNKAALSRQFAILAWVVADIDDELVEDEIKIILSIAQRYDKLDVDLVRQRLMLEKMGLHDYESHSEVARSIAEEHRELMFKALSMVVISDFKVTQNELVLLGNISDIWGFGETGNDIFNEVVEKFTSSFPNRELIIEEE